MIYVKVFDADALNEYEELKGLKGWIHGFVREVDGTIVLCEITRIEGPDSEIGYSYASSDIFSKEDFDATEKESPGFYNGKSWEEYRSWALKDILKYKEHKEEIPE